MRCPSCGEPNEEGYQFCRVCGHTLSGPPAAPRNTSATVKPGSSVTTAPAVPTVATAVGVASYRLVATGGFLSGRTFTVAAKGVTVGRDQTKCQIVLADDQISRQHAWVGLNEAGDVVVRDNGSSNGTYVNQVRVKEAVLKPKDHIAFGTGGKHLFQLEEYVAGPTVVARKLAAEPDDGHVETSVVNQADI